MNHTKRSALCVVAILTLHLSGTAEAQVPQIINYQGRVAVGTTNFNGQGAFKFALVNAAGTTTYWSNNGSSTAGSQPTAAVSLTVTKGLYSVLLGDTTLPNMTAIPNSVFNNADVRLRVWFDDGTANGSQLLTPDQRLAAVSYAMMAGSVQDGAITSAKIAAGAVGASQLTNRAVGTAQLADFAVTAGKLRLGMEVGTAADGTLTLTGGTLAFTHSFAYPFAVAPSVAFLSSGWMPAAVSTTGFTTTRGLFSSTLSGTGVVGQHTSLAVVDGNAAISYFDATSGDLKFLRALTPDGTWGAAVTVDSVGTVGQYTSLAVVNGNPAVSYYDTIGDLKYVRAADADGLTWITPVTVDAANNVGQFTSLAVVDGNPAVVYFDVTNSDLKYVRATDANGVGWATPITLDSTGNVGQYASLTVVGGNPAVSYYDASGYLKYLRATNATGTAWAAPVVVDGTGSTGAFTSLVVVNGSPAIGYFDVGHGDLRYVRATDTIGAAWGTPATVDSTGTVGQYASLAVINGTPAIAYWDVFNNDLKYVRAADVNGGAWGTPLAVDTTGGVGSYASLALVNGSPAISYYDGTNFDLKFVTIPELRWQASDGTTAPVIAARVSEAAIGSSQLAANAVQSANIAPGVVGSQQLGPNLALSGTTSGIFSGNGSGLTGLNASQVSSGMLSDSVLSSNIPRLSGGTLSDTVLPSNILRLSSVFSLTGDMRLNDHDFYLRSGSDRNCGLGWYGASKPFGGMAVDGPVLYGLNGGALGWVETNPGTGIISPHVLFRWDNAGSVNVVGAKLGIGVADPDSQLDVAISSTRHLRIRTDTSTIPVIEATSTNGGDGLAGYLRLRNAVEIWPNAAGTSAGHLDVRDATGTPVIALEGSTGEVTVKSLISTGEATVKVLNITGGADIAEPFQIAGDTIPDGAVVVIDEVHPGQLRMSDRAYDTKVAGIVSGANGVHPGIAIHQEGVVEGGQNVALSGRVYVLADSSGGAIKPGDLLTTSGHAGHAMKAGDPDRAKGATLGKAMSALTEEEGYVLVLVTLQ